MIVYVDSENKIKAVNTTSDSSLTALEINDDANPFNGWSTAKICCYKVTVQDGSVIMMTPYVPSANLEAFNNVGKQVDINTEGIEENDVAVCDVAELEDSDSQAIDELAEIIDTNSSAIDDLAELVDELLQEIHKLKGGTING